MEEVVHGVPTLFNGPLRPESVPSSYLMQYIHRAMALVGSLGLIIS